VLKEIANHEELRPPQLLYIAGSTVSDADPDDLRRCAIEDAAVGKGGVFGTIANRLDFA
jgi:hypothetical protein